MLRHRISNKSCLRLVAGCLAGMLAIAACASSESTDGERDRNINVGVALGNFGDPETGIASTRLGDLAFRLPQGAQTRRQTDGSWLVMISSVSISDAGYESLYSISRMSADGVFDDAFGTNGVVAVRVPASEDSFARLTQYGQLLVLGYETERINDEATRFWPAEMLRFDATTGALDQSFSGGALTFDEELRNSRIYSFDGGKGDTVVVVSAPNDSPTTYTMTQFMRGARNRLFGGGFFDGESGNVILPTPGVEDKPFNVQNAFVNLESDGTITTLLTLSKWACVGGNTEPECAEIPIRRGIGVQQFSAEGAPMLKLAEEAGDGILWIDAEENPNGVFVNGFQLTAVDVDDASEGYNRMLTVALDSDVHNVYRTNPEYSRFDNDALVTPNGLNIDKIDHAEYTGALGPVLAYLPLVTPLLVGSLADPSPGGSFFWSATMSAMEPTYGPRIGDFPFSFLKVSDLQLLDSGTFTNIKTLGASLFGGGGLETLWSGRGYAKFDAAGKPNALFTGAQAMTRSPLDGVNPFATELILNTELLAGDGDYFYTAGVQGLAGAAPSLRLQRYNAGGGAGARPDGDPITIKTGDVAPLAFGHKWLVTDGNDSVYFRSIRGNEIGVGKALISTGGLDESYGDAGFAALGTTGPNEPGSNQLPDVWFEAALQMNADGSVDAIALAWKEPEPDSPAPIMVTTRRVPANGKTDLSSPSIRFVTGDELEGCGCWEFIAPQEIVSVSVDPKQRVIIATVDGEQREEDGGQFKAYVELVRYTTDGAVDSTFGADGTGSARLKGLSGLMELPPVVVPRSDGEYLVGYASVEVTYGEGDNFVLDGQYLNVARVSTTGTPVDFTAPAPNPAADRVAELINSAPAPGAPTGGIAALPAADQPAVAAVEQSAAAAALPADVVRVSPDNTVRITLATSVADRAIDVRWSVPAALVGSSAKYTVTATPGGQKCVTATTSCVFKKLDPWTAYTFSVKTVSASSGAPTDSLASNPVKPVRIVKRGSRTEPTKLITPASTGKQTWKATGGCTVTKDAKSFLATKDGALCTLSLTTAKAGKVPKTTRTITVVVRAVAK